MLSFSAVRLDEELVIENIEEIRVVQESVADVQTMDFYDGDFNLYDHQDDVLRTRADSQSGGKQISQHCLICAVISSSRKQSSFSRFRSPKCNS